MKKILAVLLGIVMITSMFGCSNKGASAPASSTGDQAAGELTGTIVVWSWDVAAKALTEASVEFKKLHPKVEFQIEDLGTDQVYDKLITRLASNTGLPDVVTVEGERVATFLSKFPKGFADLTSVVNEKDFLPVKISEVSFGGKIMGFPWDGAPCGLYYRTDLFEQAGINPDNIKTWDDMITEGKKLEALGVKMMPLAASKNPTFFGMLLQQLGTYFFDEEGKTVVNSEKAVQAMTLLKKMYDSGITYDNTDWDGLVTATKEGKIATVPSAVWWAGTLRDEVGESSGKWKVMPLPAIDPSLKFGAVNGGSNVLIPEGAANKQAAIEFVKFAMTDVETQVKGFSNYGLYPSYIPSYSNPVFEEEIEYFGGQKVWKFFTEISSDIPKLNYTENFSEAADQVRDTQAKILIKDADVKAALDELQRALVNSFGQ